jgi:hypothetical protein
MLLRSAHSALFSHWTQRDNQPSLVCLVLRGGGVWRIHGLHAGLPNGPELIERQHLLRFLLAVVSLRRMCGIYDRSIRAHGPDEGLGFSCKESYVSLGLFPQGISNAFDNSMLLFS